MREGSLVVTKQPFRDLALTITAIITVAIHPSASAFDPVKVVLRAVDLRSSKSLTTFVAERSVAKPSDPALYAVDRVKTLRDIIEKKCGTFTQEYYDVLVRTNEVAALPIHKRGRQSIARDCRER